jgi:hypothetical protein
VSNSHASRCSPSLTMKGFHVKIKVRQNYMPNLMAITQKPTMIFCFSEFNFFYWIHYKRSWVKKQKPTNKEKSLPYPYQSPQILLCSHLLLFVCGSGFRKILDPLLLRNQSTPMQQMRLSILTLPQALCKQANHKRFKNDTTALIRALILCSIMVSTSRHRRTE